MVLVDNLSLSAPPLGWKRRSGFRSNLATLFFFVRRLSLSWWDISPIYLINKASIIFTSIWSSDRNWVWKPCRPSSKTSPKPPAHYSAPLPLFLPSSGASLLIIKNDSCWGGGVITNWFWLTTYQKVLSQNRRQKKNNPQF